MVPKAAGHTERNSLLCKHIQIPIYVLVANIFKEKLSNCKYSHLYLFHTCSSKEMARRNSLYRKIANTLEEEGLTVEHASNLAREAVRQGHKGGRPAGHNDKNSKPITLTDDA